MLNSKTPVSFVFQKGFCKFDPGRCFGKTLDVFENAFLIQNTEYQTAPIDESLGEIGLVFIWYLVFLTQKCVFGTM